MRDSLDRKLAAYLRKTRGHMPYARFAKKTGLTPSTLFRLENGQQSITLARLDRLMMRLGCSWRDIFGS